VAQEIADAAVPSIGAEISEVGNGEDNSHASMDTVLIEAPTTDTFVADVHARSSTDLMLVPAEKAPGYIQKGGQAIKSSVVAVGGGVARAGLDSAQGFVDGVVQRVVEDVVAQLPSAREVGAKVGKSAVGVAIGTGKAVAGGTQVVVQGVAAQMPSAGEVGATVGRVAVAAVCRTGRAVVDGAHGVAQAVSPQQECWYFKNRRCRFGDRCRNLHVVQ